MLVSYPSNAYESRLSLSTANETCPYPVIQERLLVSVIQLVVSTSFQAEAVGAILHSTRWIKPSQSKHLISPPSDVAYWLQLDNWITRGNNVVVHSGCCALFLNIFLFNKIFCYTWENYRPSLEKISTFRCRVINLHQ